MFGIGPTELVVILVIALLVLGPKRLPELASGLGKGLAEFRRATRDINAELDEARRALEDEAKAASRDTRPEPRVSRTAAVPRRAPGAAPAAEAVVDETSRDDDERDEHDEANPASGRA